MVMKNIHEDVGINDDDDGMKFNSCCWRSLL